MAQSLSTREVAVHPDIDLARIYRDMVRCRTFEDVYCDLLDEGHPIVGWHSCIGEEALCAVYSQLRDGDFCGYTHRIFYPWLCRGIDVASVFGEACGRATGTAKGKGGTHIADLARGVLGRSGMQGGHFPLFVGTAIASQLRGDDAVSVVTSGEGCSTIGLLHEAANHAAVWKLPVVFLVHNNEYMQSIDHSMIWAQPDVSRMAYAYDMPSAIVPGDDPVAVAIAAHEAIERARRGDGPTFLELKMLRWGPHYRNEPDGLTYRDYDRIEAARDQSDPINKLGAYLIAGGLASQEDLDRVHADARAEMEAAAEAAVAAPLPDVSEAFTDIFSGWDKPEAVTR